MATQKRLVRRRERAADPNRLTDSERQQGWRLLFDGRLERLGTAQAMGPRQQSTAGSEEITGKPFPSSCWTVEDGTRSAVRLENPEYRQLGRQVSDSESG
jgi:hypothetical protein